MLTIRIMFLSKTFREINLEWNTQETDACKEMICSSPWNESSSVYYGNVLNETYFWLEGVVQSLIAAIGLLGNIFTILVFTSTSFRSNFHAYLTILACFDLGYTLTILIHEALQMHDFMLTGKCYIDPMYNPSNTWLTLYPQMLYPFLGIFAVASEYFTVIISLDRYIAIKYPLYYYVNSNRHSQYIKTANNPSSNKGRDNMVERTVRVDFKRLLLYVSMVLIISILYCVPLFLEYEEKSKNIEK